MTVHHRVVLASHEEVSKLLQFASQSSLNVEASAQIERSDNRRSAVEAAFASVHEQNAAATSLVKFETLSIVLVAMPSEPTSSLASIREKAGSIPALLFEGTAAQALGFAVWGSLLKEPNLIEGDKAAILAKGYLPQSLSEEGTGIFFDERLVARLRTVGVVHDNETVSKIASEGGWATMAELTARLRVDVQRGNDVDRRRLLVTPLLPLPPIKPVALSDAIQERVSFLYLLGVKSTILRAERGFVYELDVPASVGKYIKGRTTISGSLLNSLAYLTALFEQGLLVAAPSISIPGFPGVDTVTDYIEVGSVADADEALNPDVLRLFRTDGNGVFWTKLEISFSRWTSANHNTIRTNIANLLTFKNRRDFLDRVNALSSEMRDPAWLTRRLSTGA